MTLVAHTPIVELERAVARAQRAMRGHESRCHRARLDCRRCAIYQDALDAALNRLDAARSQVPDRGAWGRAA